MPKKTKSVRKKSDIKMLENLDKNFLENFGERFGNERIEDVNIAIANKDYIRLFGANKNLYRSIPSMIDGLKPGARRLLYSWFEISGKPTNPKEHSKLKFMKVDRISSNSTGKYHPHGSVSTDDLIGKFGQYWSNNVMLIDAQGSYGNMRGDTVAAGRYREARLSEFTIDCFFDDFYSYCVPMKLAYGGDLYEPEILPAKYPYILLNPQFSGLGYGLASNIPPFNFNEVMDVTIKLIKNKKSKIFLVPDFPSGCDIIDTGDFEDINKTGKGQVIVKSSVDIDYSKNIIHIKNLPYNSSSKSVVSAIADIRDKDKKDNKDSREIKPDDFNNIIEINDSTKEGNVDIELVLSKNAIPDKILKKLYKKNTGLKTTFPVGIIAIDDYQSYDYNIKNLLLEWINYRRDNVMSMLLNKLQILLNKQHMNEVLIMVFSKDNIDDTITIAKTSKSKSETVDRLMKRFKITSIQADTIAGMRVYNFNKDSHDKYVEEQVKLKNEIDKLTKIVNSDDLIDEFIINQLNEGKKKYGRPRQSKIISNEMEVDDGEYLLGISESGYIKKLPYKNNMSIGLVGNRNSNISVMQITNNESILLIDSLGGVYKCEISKFPESKFDEIGVEINKFYNIKGTIKGVFEIPSDNVLEIDDDIFSIIFITKNGLSKRVKLSEFEDMVNYKNGISLNKGDELSTVLFTNRSDINNDIIICTNKGNGIRLPLSEVRTATSVAKGVNMITLNDDEEVSGASIIDPKKKILFYITSQGRMKLTEMKYFPQLKRKDAPLNLIKLNSTENLLGVESVNKNNVVMVFKKISSPENVNINSIKMLTRISKGEKMVQCGKGDSVIGYKLFK